VNFISIELPAVRVTFAGETLELGDASLGVVTASDGLKIVANELVKAFAEGFGSLAGSVHQLIVDGEGDVHRHSICGHGLCVKWRYHDAL
jgi:hypothetical protein